MQHRIPALVAAWACALVMMMGRADTVADRLPRAPGRAGENAGELRKALAEVPDAQREGMRFLIAHMPDRDLETLTADFLLEHTAYAYRARAEVPWGDHIPDDIFLNDVLAYCVVNERRDAWRKDFHARLKPLVAKATTPSQAATILNRAIFPQLKVQFSRKRPKANQSPYETIEAGMASCTGLSILLIDACRAVGVPARLAGTPLWADRSGNHSWVEVWDEGWHYTGAAEPSGDQLDRGWFTAKAATAKHDHHLHAIYATSFARTGTSFPMVWARDVTDVWAVNVTDRYAPRAEEPTARPTDAEAPHFDVEASLHAVAQLERYLKTPHDQRPTPADAVFADVPLTRKDAAKATALLCADHATMIRKTRAAEMEARKLTDGDLEMPFFYSVTGDKPEGGRSLYISLHGGGGAPKRVNDSQWENQKRLYQVPEGVYLAPRAPTNTWNLWHQSHIDGLFGRLIENLIVFEDVDPSRVYILGFSAGGDGVYQLAPRMADRLAAAAMMSGHPNEASPLGLRNLPFTIHAGGKDGAYNRNTVAREWGKKLDELQAEDPDGYVHWTRIYEEKGHWLDREDAAAIPWMARHTRTPLPNRIVWYQDDVAHPRFYWLAVPRNQQRKGTLIRAQLSEQMVALSSDTVDTVIVRFNDDMLDMDQDVIVRSGDRELVRERVPRTIDTIAGTLAERGDPAAVFSGEITVALPGVDQP